jgi:hypothetical protein
MHCRRESKQDRHKHHNRRREQQPGLRNLGWQHTTENLSVKHYMNTTWVSRTIPEDRPSEQELLGEFYGSEIV